MSNRAWFYASEGQQHGPYPETQLHELIAQGTVTAETLVWTEGMVDWQRAAEIPDLLSGASGPPAMPGAGGALRNSSGPGGGPLSVEFGVWELTWRTLVLTIGSLLVIPLPWVIVMYSRWLVSRVHVPQRPNLGFTGRPMDLWWYFAGIIVFFAIAVMGNQYANLLVFLAQVVLYWLVIKWFVANISSDGQPLALKFEGSFWGYLGWNALAIVSAITIIGPAWVLAAQTRWMCRNIAGTRRAVVFNGSGWEILWRGVVTAIASAFIIPIPWVMRWFARWYVSQVELIERTA
jgi:GYF domain 2